PVVISDPRGIIEYVNAEFTRKLGYDPSDVVGKDTRRFSLELETDQDFAGRWEILLAGKVWSGQLRNRTKSGEVIWFNLMIAPIKDTSGNVEHFVAFREDITEKVRMFEEVVAAKEKAEEMVKLKSDFLAAMSHELRTPFIGIMGFAEILMSELEDPELQNMAGNILQSSLRIKRTLTGILRITELENNHSAIIFPAPVNLAELIDNNISSFSSFFTRRNLTLTKNIEGVRKNYLLDKTCMNDIVAHILGNAVNYTENGGVTIDASETVIDDRPGVMIRIADTGIGIPDERQQMIFEEFRQVSEGHSRSYEGSGLGLSIVKKTVEILGGTVKVKSKCGEGSQFTVTIPVITT
ncbi:MAG: PAS domain-containing sensor histidine kinase, partial [Chlorobiota bacterium]